MSRCFVPNTPRRETIALYLILGMVAFSMIIRIGSDIFRTVSSQEMLSDDAYYYLVVSKNFVSTGKTTFDGFSITNGYHPLWFWTITVMYALGGLHLSQLGQVTLIIIAEHLILAGTVVAVMIWVYRHWTTQRCSAVIVLLGLCFLLYPRHVFILTCGMETILVLLFLTLFLFFVYRSQWNWAGLSGMLLVMSRLDTAVYIVFPVALLTMLWDKRSFSPFLKRCLQIAGPSAASVIILMWTYQATFGHSAPISGVCKSSFPVPHIQWHLLTWQAIEAFKYGNLTALAYINESTSLAILPICGVVLTRSGFLSRRQRNMAMLLVVLGLIQLTNFLLFQKWAKPIPPWYLIALIIFCSGAIASAMTNVINRQTLLTILLIIAAVTAALYALREYKYLFNPSFRNPSLRNFIDAQPKGTIWAATDCGGVSFWTNTRFVNLDGLINGFEYQAALREGKLKDYLQKCNVRYLLVGIWKDKQRHFFEPMYAHRTDPGVFAGEYETFDYYVYSYMYDTYSDIIKLDRRQEVWRSEPGWDGVPARSVVFDLNK